MGNNYAVSDDDFKTVVCDEFEKRQWSVIPVHVGNPVKHMEKWLMISRAFRGQSGLFPMLNREGMAFLTFDNVAIRAIAACVPPKKVFSRDLHYLIPKEDVAKTINSIGIEERREAGKDVCPSDLCFRAAEKLLEDNSIDRNSIDVLLFLSQLPDYKIPATSPILQQRLGLPKTTAALDLSLGCSGYVYALATAMAFAGTQGGGG